ncbi:MAG: glycoside hydrolase family 15 protein [Anaerolineales bacterium]
MSIRPANGLYQHSIDVILENQNQTGAYLASPTFPTYRYSWFRDGAYIAYAMGLVGEHESAGRFHEWAAGVVNRRELVVRGAVNKVAAGEALGMEDVLHTRYSLEGGIGEEEWPNFQLDGFGTWLWALAEHLRASGLEISEVQRRAAQLVAEYLGALWRVPCSDCWEEFPDKVHTHTLAAIYGGLCATEGLLGVDHEEIRGEIRRYILEYNFEGGRFVKFDGAPEVDASLLGLALPYKVFELDDPGLQATIEQIDSNLRVDGGGVHRYPTDTYYGGGEWVVLAGWLGWYYAEVGDEVRAMELLTWMEEQADVKGDLPEQVPMTLNDETFYKPWRERWGDIAQPLLWSHANYLILARALGLGA